ncbi:MAG: hypothetical protein LBD50_00115 [Rickettsiales bacterium]|jgi:hypothetical protein|nr:hypothetical protein [Rickettsiales bacterium]
MICHNGPGQRLLLACAWILIFESLAPAATILHYGAYSSTLTEDKKTTPSLNVSFSGKTYFGALGIASGGRSGLNLSYGSNQYVLGEYCAEGTYSANGVSPCADCAAGHYCMGGIHRAPCDYGIFSCPGANHAHNPSLPAGAVGKTNRILTLAEVNTAGIPATDISQWGMVSCCAERSSDEEYPNTDFVNVLPGCAEGGIGPGVYLFFDRTGNFCYGSTDLFSNQANMASSVYIAIFDRAVSYRTMHVPNYFNNWLDLDHDVFTDWDIKVPENFCKNDNQTNISNLGTVPQRNICVYRLK